MMWRSGPFFDPNRNQKPEQPTNLKILSPRLLPGTMGYGIYMGPHSESAGFSVATISINTNTELYHRYVKCTGTWYQVTCLLCFHHQQCCAVACSPV